MTSQFFAQFPPRQLVELICAIFNETSESNDAASMVAGAAYLALKANNQAHLCPRDAAMNIENMLDTMEIS